MAICSSAQQLLCWSASSLELRGAVILSRRRNEGMRHTFLSKRLFFCGLRWLPAHQKQASIFRLCSFSGRFFQATQESRNFGKEKRQRPLCFVVGDQAFSSLVFFVFEATGGWYPDAREKGQPVMKLPCSLCVQQ